MLRDKNMEQIRIVRLLYWSNPYETCKNFTVIFILLGNIIFICKEGLIFIFPILTFKDNNICSLEVWYYTALILFAGYLKNAEVSVDALSIWSVFA